MDATAFCSNHVWKRWFGLNKLSINAPLFDDDRPPKPEIAEGEGPAILQSEVKNYLMEMRNNKAAG